MAISIHWPPQVTEEDKDAMREYCINEMKDTELVRQAAHRRQWRVDVDNAAAFQAVEELLVLTGGRIKFVRRSPVLFQVDLPGSRHVAGRTLGEAVIMARDFMLTLVKE